ncbi:MAG TPA: CocE/NonD family hydrolase, partial [Actinomycetota bacterium]|nr:CocE/NonD family hydrolase [Actinomycetota bacterium]
MQGFPHDVVRTPNEWITLPDRTRLAARLWRPDTDEPVPAILEYLPYRKGDSMAARDESIGAWFAGHGYAYVRVDIRGTGDSDGVITDEYTLQEHDDALAVIAWLADAPWCSGAIGMVGISWGGFNSLQVAARRPPALKAVISICSTDDRYADDVHYKGGCVLACDALPWASVMLAYDALPPDPVTVGDGWKETWLRRLDETPPFISAWVTHQRRDDYWKHGSICEDYGAIECPVYMVGGWADGYTNAILRTLEGLPGVRKGLIGPWPHSWPHVAAQGPRIDFLTEALRWWDRWLKEETNGIDDEPMLTAWMQEPATAGALHLDRPGRWVSEPSWPAPSVERRRLFLGGEGALTAEPSDAAELRHAGAQHHGSFAGLWCPYGPETVFPLDQRSEDALCLTFDTAPLEARMEMLGHPRLRLTLTADRPLAFVVARLCRVAPDGSSTLISRGALNLTHREGHERPEALEPGNRYEVEVELDVLGQAVAVGDRLRLAISTTYWPWLWPSPDGTEITI